MELTILNPEDLKEFYLLRLDLSSNLFERFPLLGF